MAIFGRGSYRKGNSHLPDETPTAERAGTTRSELTVISVGSSLEGFVVSHTDVRVDGQVKGDVSSAKRVEIAESGSVQGNVEAREVIVAGSVVGSIRCREKVEIAATGTVDGDVSSRRLVVVEGGVLNGGSKIGAKSAAGPRELEPAPVPEVS